MNGNSIHTGPEQDRFIPIKLQLGPGVELIGGVTPPHTPLICAPDHGRRSKSTKPSRNKISASVLAL